MTPRKRTTMEPSTRVTRSSTRTVKPTIPPPKSPLKKKAKKSTDISKEKKVNFSSSVLDGSKKKTIIVEYCKQCNAFKTRALFVKDGLEKGMDGAVNVVLNPEKPRRGCFEIREDGENGEKFITLLDMKRPFKPMKDLVMDEVVSDILDKIKG
ncbi:OLC1v1029625C1 [Oldenlandia corymbosa var. corymbosa]|uniref:OLC1v1029625C1 n=1 Tax=Oldenlandia corymbosa var. corymbosa TaxID=529605 RepID=A0AAV1CF72_OLDCO|nr:OLC1v1029625C1 [Oldenlandia corymbosa var. corymbosa]